MKCTDPEIGKHVFENEALEDETLSAQVSVHLEQCALCRSEWENYKSSTQALAKGQGAHLSSEELYDYASEFTRQRLTEEERSRISEHLQTCESCRTLSDRVQAADKAFPEPSANAPLPEGWSREREARFVARLAETLAEDEKKYHMIQEQAQELSVTPATQAATRSAVAQKPFHLKPRRSLYRALAAVIAVCLIGVVFIVWWSGRNPTLPPGYRAPNTFQLESPADGAVVRAYEEFRWRAVANAANYILTIREQSSGQVVLEHQLKQNNFYLSAADSASLNSGAAYEWFVKTRVGEEDIQSNIRSFNFAGQPTGGAYSDFPESERDSMLNLALEGDTQELGTLRDKLDGYLASRPNEQSLDRAWALYIRAVVLYGLDQNKEAAESIQEALSIWDAIGAPKPEEPPANLYARALTNYGLFSQNIGQLDTALGAYRKALDIIGQRSDEDSLSRRATCLLNMGTLYREIGLPKHAKRAYSDALAIDRDKKNNENLVAEDLLNIGNIEVDELANTEAGLKLLEESLSIHREIVRRTGKPGRNMAATLDGLATAYRFLGKQQQALAHFEEALKLDPERKDKTGFMATTINIGDLLLEDLGDTEGARLRYLEAIKLAGGEVDVDPDFRWRAYDGMGRAELNRGDFKAAEEYFLEALRIAHEMWNELDEAQFRRAFNATHSSPYYGLGLLKLRQQDAAAFFAAMEDGRATFLKPPANVRGNAAQGAATLDQIRADLGADQAFVSYLCGSRNDKILLLAATRDEVLTAELTPPLKTIDQLTHQVISDFSAGLDHTEARRRLLDLSNYLLPETLGSLFKRRSIKHVLVSPDGPLYKLPFEALQITLHGTQPDYLIKNFNISTVPALRWWREMSRKQNPFKNADALIVADPVIAPGACRSKSALFNEVMSDDRGIVLDNLPYTAREADVVLSYASHNTLSLRSDQARSERFVAASPENFKVIHFATHAVSGGNLDTSFLLFGCQDKLDALAGAEIPRLKLDGQLVILSACDTDVGDSLTGEGNDSLASGFLLGGAECVVATRWRIKDDTTVTLMRFFYENLADGLPVDDALRAAKIRYVAEINSNPQKWAAFTVSGYGGMRVLITPSLKIRMLNFLFRPVVIITSLLIIAIIMILIFIRKKRKHNLQAAK